MMIHEITALAGKYKARKRVGRGTGSGTGRRSGKGQKGASSRSGYAAKVGFEGGQMPYFRRLRKFGFSNAKFSSEFWIVNLRAILAHPSFAKGGDVNADTLIKAGLIRDLSRDLKILGDLGDAKTLTVKLNIHAARVSAQARKIIEDAGGKVDESGTRRDKVRGVDRNAEDQTPKNLTKKLKRSKGPKKVVEEAADATDAKKTDAKKGDKPKPDAKATSEAKPGAESKPKTDAKPKSEDKSKPEDKPKA